MDPNTLNYFVELGIFQKAIQQGQQRAKADQAKRPQPHPSGLNRHQRRAEARQAKRGK